MRGAGVADAVIAFLAMSHERLATRSSMARKPTKTPYLAELPDRAEFPQIEEPTRAWLWAVLSHTTACAECDKARHRAATDFAIELRWIPNVER